jgi:hypothetical protein
VDFTDGPVLHRQHAAITGWRIEFQGIDSIEAIQNIEVPIAWIALHGVRGDCPEDSPFFFLNPATGAVEVHPSHRDKVARSMARRASKIKRRLLFLQLRFQIGYFALQLRCSVPRLLRHFKGNADETVSYHHDHLSGASHSDPRQLPSGPPWKVSSATSGAFCWYHRRNAIHEPQFELGLLSPMAQLQERKR